MYEGEEDYIGEDVMIEAEGEDKEIEQSVNIKEFTTEEIQSAIDRLKKKGRRKTAMEYELNSSKLCSDETKEEIRTIFNEIAQQEDFTPKSWRKIRIQVIYKKGDRENAGNYRPICGLPILYKLFATVLYARLAPGLHRIQPPDQAGFRPNHRCEDHLMVYRVLEQRCREWGVPLYISTIDFTKAFDSIKHSALWKSLRFYGVKPAYIKLLQRLYSQQEGTVLTDKESDVFSIKRGTKQGDPLSSLLFNTVLQYSLEEDLKRWQEKRKGIKLSDANEDCLTNLRFADDVLLFSTSLEKLREMLCEFKISTEAVGLGIHPDKTKRLSNQDKIKAKEVEVENIKIEILGKTASARYLGQKITFEDQETEEILQTESSVGSVPQISPGVDIERLSPLSQTSLFQHGGNTDDDLCQQHVDIDAETRKDDQDRATKDASPDCTDEKKIQNEKSESEQKRRGHRKRKRGRQRRVD